jgi:putative membrane protein
MKHLFYAVIAVLAAFVGVTFAFQNQQLVELRYYFGFSWRGPLSLVLLAALAIGVGLGYLAALRTVLRLQRELVRARREIRAVEQEVANLRALPIKDVV